MKLFQFDSSGYYAALTREAAVAAVVRNIGLDPEDAEQDFLREVPGDEMILAISEDPWDHPSQTITHKEQGARLLTWYSLRLTATEHALGAPAHGYCFGGEQ